jgi:short-subunit dehydrogenase
MPHDPRRPVRLTNRAASSDTGCLRSRFGLATQAAVNADIDYLRDLSSCGGPRPDDDAELDAVFGGRHDEKGSQEAQDALCVAAAAHAADEADTVPSSASSVAGEEPRLHRSRVTPPKAGPSPRPATLDDRYGGWALITGASSGIGLALAHVVAGEGMSCFLVSDDGPALDEACEAVRSDHDAEVEGVCVDLAGVDAAERVREHVGDRDLGMLINNASIGRVGPFVASDIATYRRMLAVNVDAYLSLSREFAPRLIERGRGALVFVSSINAAATGIGGSVVYTATKAFETSLACGLWQELRPAGIDVLLVMPGPTRTGFQREAGTAVASWAMEPDEVANGALRELGRRLVHIPGEVNDVLARALHQLAIEPRVQVASRIVDAALIRGTM